MATMRSIIQVMYDSSRGTSPASATAGPVWLCVADTITRPDGHHWLSLDGRREFGPFNSFEEAVVDMQTDDEESAAEPGETLQEAEFEIGMADWIDPDTGEPAEGQSTPRLHDE